MAYRRMTHEQLMERLAAISGGDPSKLAYSQVSIPVPSQQSDPFAAAAGDAGTADRVRPAEQWTSPDGHSIQVANTQDGWFDVIDDTYKPPASAAQRQLTPDEISRQNSEGQVAAVNARTANAEEQEKIANQRNGYGYRTNAEVAQDIAAKEREQRAKDAAAQQQLINQQNAATAAQQATNAANSLNEQIRHNQVTEQGKPQIVGSPSDTNAQIGVFDPNTGAIKATPNPLYDQVKAQAEQERQRIATEIAQRRMNLDEGIQQYTQWFDQNVKIPFMQSTEARDRAKEQRDALDAEERRRQFAADFSLRKGQLGQQAGAAAMQAEESLLPYRTGPTEAANMSDAINGLAAGGNPQGPSAAAGIHFSPTDFQFNAPDFKSIAKSAAKQALSGLTNYRPAEGSYQTADYSGINLPNAQTPSSAPVISSGGRYAGPSGDSAPVNTPPPATDYDYSGPPPD
jgi:hypothetical protein